MVRPVWVFGFLAIYFVAVLFVADAVPEGDPFTETRKNAKPNLDLLSAKVVAELKFNHVRAKGPYDVVVFGNSRSLNFTNPGNGFNGCSFFNFSIGGESLRTSIALMERLAEAGVAPRNAIVSVDHFELQRYHNPYSLWAPRRWSLLALDLWGGLSRTEISFREWLRMAWRHLRSESRLFEQNFSIELFMTSLKLKLGLASDLTETTANGLGYSADGSRSSPPVPTDQRATERLSPISPQFLFGYLKYDFERLKTLQDQGVNMILYETPLESKSARFFAENPSPFAAATRTRFTTLCRDLSLRCYTAPREVPYPDLPWPDHSHPPAKTLAAYLTTRLAGDVKGCRK